MWSLNKAVQKICIKMYFFRNTGVGLGGQTLCNARQTRYQNIHCVTVTPVCVPTGNRTSQNRITCCGEVPSVYPPWSLPLGSFDEYWQSILEQQIHMLTRRLERDCCRIWSVTSGFDEISPHGIQSTWEVPQLLSTDHVRPRQFLERVKLTSAVVTVFRPSKPFDLSHCRNQFQRWYNSRPADWCVFTQVCVTIYRPPLSWEKVRRNIGTTFTPCPPPFRPQ